VKKRAPRLLLVDPTERTLLFSPMPST